MKKNMTIERAENLCMSAVMAIQSKNNFFQWVKNQRKIEDNDDLNLKDYFSIWKDCYQCLRFLKKCSKYINKVIMGKMSYEDYLNKINKIFK